MLSRYPVMHGFDALSVNPTSRLSRTCYLYVNRFTRNPIFFSFHDRIGTPRCSRRSSGGCISSETYLYMRSYFNRGLYLCICTFDVCCRNRIDQLEAHHWSNLKCPLPAGSFVHVHACPIWNHGRSKSNFFFMHKWIKAGGNQRLLKWPSGGGGEAAHAKRMKH